MTDEKRKQLEKQGYVVFDDDPIKQLKELGWLTEDEIKEMEKDRQDKEFSTFKKQ